MRMLSKASEDRIIDVYFVTVPESGGNRSFAIGITKIDFKTGIVINPDGTIEELSRRLNLVQDKDVMHSISIHSDHDMKFRLNSSGQQTVDADFLFQLPFVTYTTLEIECEYVTNLNLFACTNPQATLGTFKVTSMTQQTILGDGVELDTYDSITSLLSNLNRIRYQIKILSGEANWDDAPDTDLSSVGADIATHAVASVDVHGVGAGNSVASDDDIATHEADTSVHGVAEVADKATVSTEIDNDISTHGAVSTNIHGVGAGNSVASDDDIATHANEISTHGVSGTIQGSEDKDVANGIAGLNASTRLSTDIGGMPTGVILPFGGAAAPNGYALCDGAAISRTIYSALFGVIGISYGVGDGSTTFNVPDLQGNVPVGKGGSGVTNRGDTGGEQTHTLITSEMPAHVHNTKGWDTDGGSTGFALSGTAVTNKATYSTGGDGAHENMQPYVGTEYIIKT